jgi:toxin ParE1/3/4
MTVVYGEGVFEELVEIAAYLAQDDSNLAIRFLDRCDETFDFLCKNPRAGVSRRFGSPLLRDVRMWRVADFENYLIFYHVRTDDIKIMHVVHGARNYELLFGTED